MWWASDHLSGPYHEGWRKIVIEFRQDGDASRLTLEAVLQGGLRYAHRLVGLGFLAILLMGTLHSSSQWLRHGRKPSRTECLLAIYGALYLLTAFMFAVHFVELRYLSPVVGIAIFAMVAHTRSLTQWVVLRVRS